MDALGHLRATVLQAAGSLGGEPKGAPSLERPKQADHGDYATNAAMLLAKPLKSNPREVAAKLAEALQGEFGDTLVSVDIAGPGFLNLTLADAWFADALAGVIAAGESYGAGGAPRKRNINLEFVSGNPTGPLHIGHSRHAAFGDVLARMLVFVGHDVHREYYVNDYGSQVRTLAASIQARARGEEIPEDGYPGEYVQEAAAAIPGAAEMDLDALAVVGVDAMLDKIRGTLERFGITYDTWFHERSLHDGDPSAVERSWAVLEKAGLLFRDDGALWMRTTDFGDDKDRVLERTSGEHTYFSSDVAYHEDKRERGFDLLINLWGADHHGYIQRIHAMWQALGGDPADLELLIMQLVSLTENGEPVRMGKRTGVFITLDELLDLVGTDAARWFLLQRSHDTQMEFDVGLAKQKSSDNPVYYVQYAHARIASIRRRSTVEPSAALAPGAAIHPSEKALIKALLAFGDEITDATERRMPHRVCTYALETAQTFTAFYRDCPIVGAENEAFRLALAGAAQQVLAQCLALLGISAPEEM